MRRTLSELTIAILKVKIRESFSSYREAERIPGQPVGHVEAIRTPSEQKQ